MLYDVLMRTLVTGVAGFLGSTLANNLLMNYPNINLMGIDCFTNNYSRYIKEKNISNLKQYDNFYFIEGELSKLDLNRILDGVDTIFHFAGQPSVQNSWGDDFYVYLKNNIEVTHKLLLAAQKRNIKKFINSSSSSVYGHCNSIPTSEKTFLNPVSPYGVTKLAAENLVTLFGTEFGLNAVSLRYFTVYGPKQRPDMAFHKLIAAAVSGERFLQHGDGTQMRDFTFVDDVVRANIMASDSNLPAGAVINIGSGSPISLNEAISIIEEYMSRKINIEFKPSGPGNPKITYADNALAQRKLNWVASTDIREGLEKQIRWQIQ